MWDTFSDKPHKNQSPMQTVSQPASPPKIPKKRVKKSPPKLQANELELPDLPLKKEKQIAVKQQSQYSVTIKKLQEAVIWSEILGPPVSLRES